LDGRFTEHFSKIKVLQISFNFFTVMIFRTTTTIFYSVRVALFRDSFNTFVRDALGPNITDSRNKKKNREKNYQNYLVYNVPKGHFVTALKNYFSEITTVNEGVNAIVKNIGKRKKFGRSAIRLYFCSLY